MSGWRGWPVLLGLVMMPAPVVAGPAPEALFGKIDRIYADFARDNHIPGLIYGVVAAGELVHVKGIGVQDIATGAPVTQDSVFRIASLTKAFTALAALHLRDEGRLRLDDPVSRYIPELRVIPPQGVEAREIGIADLLDHTAGFVTDDPWGDRQLAMSEDEFSAAIARGVPMARAPGQFDYSNYGYTLLGRAIARASGQSYQHYIGGTLLDPLGMAATGWEVADIPKTVRVTGYRWEGGRNRPEPVLGDGAFGAMAGLHSSARDYARYVVWLLSAWSDPGTQKEGARTEGPVLAASTVREAGTGAAYVRTQVQTGADGQPCASASMYGYGFYVVQDCRGRAMLRHAGGLPGYGSQVLLMPDRGIGIFAFANLTYAAVYKPTLAAADLLAASDMGGRKPPPPSADALAAVRAAMAIYRAGDYGGRKGLFADNLLLDHGLDVRNAALGDVRRRLGACGEPEQVEAPHALAARLRARCEQGMLGVSILLAPTIPATIQYLEYEALPPEEGTGQ